jgi:hypothetical protein
VIQGPETGSLWTAHASNESVRTAGPLSCPAPIAHSEFECAAGISDVQTADMLNLPRPTVATGKPQVVAAPASEPLKAYIKTLIKRAERLRSSRVDPSVDNMLKITGDGRKAALDMRLVDAFTDAHGDTKLNRAAERIRGGAFSCTTDPNMVLSGGRRRLYKRLFVISRHPLMQSSGCQKVVKHAVRVGVTGASVRSMI